MRKSPFYLLLLALSAALAFSSFACGDIEGGGAGESCDPEDEEVPEGFECTCEDPEDVDTCTLESLDENNANNAQDGIVDCAIEGFMFVPDTLTITVGSTVRWTNNDTDQHALEETQNDIDILLEAGEVGTFTFNTPGTFTVIDRINTSDPDFRQIITVQ